MHPLRGSLSYFRKCKLPSHRQILSHWRISPTRSFGSRGYSIVDILNDDPVHLLAIPLIFATIASVAGNYHKKKSSKKTIDESKIENNENKASNQKAALAFTILILGDSQRQK